jgi:hypothetical protein
MDRKKLNNIRGTMDGLFRCLVEAKLLKNLL